MGLKRETFQEEQYSIPYHYKDLFCEETRILLGTSAEFRLQLLCDTVKSLKPKSILDIGCGDGKFIYRIKEWCFKNKAYICGTDYDRRAIGFAKAFNPEISFTTDPISKNKRKFDLILLAEVIEHIPPKEISALLTGIADHLNKNGRLLITTPTPNLPLQQKHYQHFTLEKITNAISPVFIIEECFGFQKKGIKEKIYKILRGIGSIMYPMRHKLHLLWYYAFLKKYYFNNLGRCKVDKGYHLLAVCKLSTKGLSYKLKPRKV